MQTNPCASCGEPQSEGACLTCQQEQACADLATDPDIYGVPWGRPVFFSAAGVLAACGAVAGDGVICGIAAIMATAVWWAYHPRPKEAPWRH